MRSRLYMLVATSFFICLQHSQAQTPQEFNTKIVSSTTELYAKAALWGTTFISQYNGKQNYSELTATRVEMQEYIDEQLSTFNESNAGGGSEKLKAAVIAFYQYEKNLVQESFLPFEKLTASSSDAQINSCRERLKEEAAKEKDFTGTLNAERRAYATNNNFSLEPPPPPPAAPKKASAGYPRSTMAKPAAAKPAVAKEPVKKEAAKEEDEKDEE